MKGYNEISKELELKNLNLIEKKSALLKQLEKLSLKEEKLVSLFIDTRISKSILDKKIIDLR